MTRPRNMAALMFTGLLVAGCHGARKPANVADTRVMNASYVGSTPRMIQVQVESPGSFSNQLSLPLDQGAKVYLGEKRVTLAQVRPGQAIKVYRDVETRRVVRVEAVDPGAAHEETTVDPTKAKH